MIKFGESLKGSCFSKCKLLQGFVAGISPQSPSLSGHFLFEVQCWFASAKIPLKLAMGIGGDSGYKCRCRC